MIYHPALLHINVKRPHALHSHSPEHTMSRRLMSSLCLQDAYTPTHALHATMRVKHLHIGKGEVTHGAMRPARLTRPLTITTSTCRLHLTSPQ